MLLREMIYKYDPAQPRDEAGKWAETGGGRSWTGDPISHFNSDGSLDTQAMSDLVRQAVEERPSRAAHGDTTKNAFFLVGDKVYAWNDWSKIPNKRLAIGVHSHGSMPGQFQGEEEFQPLNSGDVYLWLRGFRRGEESSASGIIMQDGRMEFLQLTENTEMSVFKLSRNKLDSLLQATKNDGQGYYERHKNDPDFHTYNHERELLRSFCRQYGITYYEGLRWKGGAAAKSLLSARWESLRAKALAGMEWGKSFEGHAGRPGKVGGSVARQGGGKTVVDLTKASESQLQEIINDIETNGRVALVRYSPDIWGDVQRDWSGWMGQRSPDKEEAVRMAVEARGQDAYTALEERFEEDEEYKIGEWGKFISDMADEYNVRFDKGTNEWVGVHHEGLAAYGVSTGKDTRSYKDPPTGQGVMSVGTVRVVGKLHADAGGAWYLLSADSSAPETTPDSAAYAVELALDGEGGLKSSTRYVVQSLLSKTFEGHAGRPGKVGGSVARAGGSINLGESNLAEWKKLGVEPDIVGSGPDGPIVRMYHGSPRAGEVYESGFASGGRNQYTGRGVEEPGFYISEKPEYAAQYGDVVTLHVPAKWVELYQTNPLDPILDRGQFLPGNEFLIRWKNSKRAEIQRGVMSSFDILDEYRRSQREDLSDYA